MILQTSFEEVVVDRVVLPATEMMNLSLKQMTPPRTTISQQPTPRSISSKGGIVVAMPLSPMPYLGLPSSSLYNNIQNQKDTEK